MNNDMETIEGIFKMDFGMPTLVEIENLEETAALCSELNLRFIELNMNFPNYGIERINDSVFLRSVADRYGIYYTIHLDENLNISDFNRLVADAYLQTVRQTITAANKLDAPLINMHMNKGIQLTLPNRKVFLLERYENLYLQSFRTFRNMCEDLINSDNVVISIENTDGLTDFQKDAIELLLESPVFSLTWDIGHSHAAHDIDESFILIHNDRLKHFHIHDASGKNNHLTLGTGEIALRERLRIAKEHQCRCVVETKTVTALRDSIEWLKNEGFMV